MKDGVTTVYEKLWNAKEIVAWVNEQQMKEEKTKAMKEEEEEEANGLEGEEKETATLVERDAAYHESAEGTVKMEEDDGLEEILRRQANLATSKDEL